MVRTVPPPLVDQRFLLLDTIGRGGTSAVYRAFDRNTERFVALKVHGAPDPPGPAHPLAQEYEAWARVRHPNIVEAHELGRSSSGPLPPGTPYLVLEHVPGGPVHRRLEPGGLAPALLERLAIDALRALDHVHRAGLVHRDVKPANLLFARGNGGGPRLKLTDFGLAAPHGQAEVAGCVSGSLPYVAPESILGLPLDARADLYGLGLVLYLLATGRPAAGSERSPEALLRWHLEGPTVDPGPVRPDLPSRLARFVARLATRDRALRPRDAEQALGLLEAGPLRTARDPALGDPLRGERARLRLALDATRLGAWRVLPCDPDPARREALARQARIACELHGLLFHDLAAGLASLVLRLLLEEDPASGARSSRSAIERWLPLDRVGELPLLDRSPRARQPPHAGAGPVARFVLARARRRPMVLLAGAHEDSLSRVVVPVLARAIGQAPRTLPRPGGLLLLLAGSHAAGVSPSATVRGS